MREAGSAPLGPFALYLDRPTWIGGQPAPQGRQAIAVSEVGPRNVPIVALRDGFIVFGFDGSADYAGGNVPAYSLGENRIIPSHVTAADDARIKLAYERFKYMNAFLLAICSGYSAVEKAAKPTQAPIDPTNYFTARFHDGRWETIMDKGRKMEYPLDNRPITNPDVILFAVELLKKSDSTFEAISFELLSLIYISCHQYAKHQFSSAHLIAWSVVEMIQNHIWKDLQSSIDKKSGGLTQISSARSKLLNGRDFTAAVVSQNLSICGKYDDRTLASVDDARRKRNNFTHALSPIDSEDAGRVIQLSADLITNIIGSRVSPPLSLSYWI